MDMPYKVEYRFERVAATDSAFVTKVLNQWLSEGWTVVSHADDDGEYSFVLKKATPQQGGDPDGPRHD